MIYLKKLTERSACIIATLKRLQMHLHYIIAPPRYITNSCSWIEKTKKKRKEKRERVIGKRREGRRVRQRERQRERKKKREKEKYCSFHVVLFCHL